MKLKELFTTIKKHVSKKQADREQSKNSYLIYDKCDACPLSAYIDAVCNDSLKGLIISGNPSEEVLLMTRSALTIEFSELSGNSEAAIVTNLLKQMYFHQAQIQGFGICINLIKGGRFDDVDEYLKTHGVKVSKPTTEDEISRIIKHIEGKIKGKTIQFEQLQKRYTAINANSNTSGKPKTEYYTELLIALSKYAGFHLKKEKLTLSEFALYLKDFNMHIETLNNKSHGRQ